MNLALSSRSWVTRSLRAACKLAEIWGNCRFLGEPVGVAVADLEPNLWKKKHRIADEFGKVRSQKSSNDRVSHDSLFVSPSLPFFSYDFLGKFFPSLSHVFLSSINMDVKKNDFLIGERLDKTRADEDAPARRGPSDVFLFSRCFVVFFYNIPCWHVAMRIRHGSVLRRRERTMPRWTLGSAAITNVRRVHRRCTVRSVAHHSSRRFLLIDESKVINSHSIFDPRTITFFFPIPLIWGRKWRQLWKISISGKI